MVILVLSGTGDGRKIEHELIRLGYSVSAVNFTMSYYESDIVDRREGWNAKTLDFESLLATGLKAVVDARHPLAVRQDDNVARDCTDRGILYLRLIRIGMNPEPNEMLYPVESMEEAALKAAGLGNTIFLTTGSHGIEHFLPWREKYGLRLVVRVLPEHRVIKKCQDMGIIPRDIIAIQGPFSKQINKALFKMYKASVVVTRDSGKAGGTDTKIEAALSLKIPVVMVKNEGNNAKYGYNLQEAIRILKKQIKLTKEGD